jgi:hypothetical protein
VGIIAALGGHRINRGKRSTRLKLDHISALRGVYDP